jgi:hypothetical protein
MEMTCAELPQKMFRVGILTTSLESVGKHTYAVSNPAAPCVVSAVATLDSTDAGVVKEWCRKHNLGPSKGDVYVASGDAGFRDIMGSSDIHAVYLALPFR